MARCAYCGSDAGARWCNTGPLLLCILAWCIPIGFLMLGTYPFGVLLMLVVTFMAARRVRRVCAHCGRAWKP